MTDDFPNPYAFPRTGVYSDQEGMSLRDWFAGQALAANGDEADSAENIAKLCYAIADAMLRERAK
jgi:hypothetical protein